MAKEKNIIRVYADDTLKAFNFFVSFVSAMQNRGMNSATNNKANAYTDAVRKLMWLRDYSFTNELAEYIDAAGAVDAKSLTKKLLKSYNIKFVQYSRAHVPDVREAA